MKTTLYTNPIKKRRGARSAPHLNVSYGLYSALSSFASLPTGQSRHFKYPHQGIWNTLLRPPYIPPVLKAGEVTPPHALSAAPHQIEG